MMMAMVYFQENTRNLVILTNKKTFISYSSIINFIDKNYQLPPSSLSFETNIRHTKKKDENIHLEEKRSIWREKAL